MHIKERKTKTGISYDLICCGRNPVTRDYQNYRKTYKLPSGLIGKKKAIEKFLLECQSEWQSEVDKLSLGTIIVKKNNIKFSDFAAEWVEDVLKYRKLSHNYYLSCQDRLKVLNEKLGNYYLQEISPSVIKYFCKWLSERTYKKEVVVLKNDLLATIKEMKLSVARLALNSGISQRTIFVCLDGQRINSDSARKLCDYLHIPLDKYFSIETQEIPYASSSSKSITSTLRAILQEAVRLELIERNYASREFIDSIKVTSSKREIFTEKEVNEFIRCISLEKDLRKKVAFSIYLHLGLRNSEVSGLEWKDIDFDKSELTVQRNSLYVGSKFGTITKEPKTKNSVRTILLSSSLVALLRKYKEAWDKDKIIHGDLWEHTDRLFVQNNGNNMTGATLANWLEKFEKKHGLKHVTPHGLRHTNITMLISKGIDVKTVSGRVGHANISTTLNIYSHFNKEGDMIAANKMDELFPVE